MPIFDLVGLAAATGGTDPSSLLTLLGPFAAAAGALVLWQRDTAKGRDRATAIVEQTSPVLVQIRDILSANASLVQNSTRAMQTMIEALQRLPSEAEVTRLRDTLGRAEERMRNMREANRRGNDDSVS